MAERIGTKSEDFIILKIIKRSEYKNKHGKIILYGYVAKVKSKLNNTIYAMKRIDLSLVENKDKKTYYLNELEIIKRFDLKHENIYRPVSYFEEKNAIYIITEYINGQNLVDLFEWHKKNKMQIEEKRIGTIFDQCLRGLNYIHKKGIIHRSIKLDNIMIDSNDRVKIINFKYAIEKDKNDKAKVNIGIFTAPEIASGEYDEKVDVYSLGIVFNLLMYFSNKLPNNRGTYSDNLYQVVKNMLKDKTTRFSTEDIYLQFKNNSYNLMRACLKCLVFLLKDKILMQQVSNENQIEKFIDLAYNIKSGKETNINQLAKEFEEDFYNSGFSINDVSPTNFTYFLLSLIKNDNILNDISNNLRISSKCSNCDNKNLSNENHYIVHFNEKQIRNKSIKDAFRDFNCRTDINWYNEACTCNTDQQMEISNKFVKLPRYLIIIIENGCEFSQINMNGLNNFELGKEENFDNKYCYGLKSIFIKNKDETKENYDYYCLHIKKFKKNEDREHTYNLKEICNQNIVFGLYYEQTNINNNDINASQSQTRETSIINGSQNDNQNNNNDENVHFDEVI